MEGEGAVEVFNAHYGEVAALVQTADRRMVVSGGDDGAVMVFSVTEYGEEGQLLGDEGAAEAATLMVDMELGDVLLVQKRDLEDYKTKLETLKHDLEELERKVEEVKQPGTVSSIRQELLETTKRMEMEKEQWERRYQELQREKDQQEKENAQKLQKSETLHKQAKQELDTLYSKRLEVEVERYRALQ